MIIGIDPSLTGTAVVKGPGLENWSMGRFGSDFVDDSVSQRVARYEQLVYEIMEFIAVDSASIIMLEAYSFGSQGRARYSAEFGGILRWHLDTLTSNIHEVAPLTLKKFAVSGKASKNVIGAHLALRYAVKFADDDAYDAFGLFAMGCVAAGKSKPLDKAQAEAVAKATQPATVSKATKKKRP